MNKVIIKGRLGQDPELKIFDNGNKVVNFSIATNDGNKENPKTNWHSCNAWNKTAEIIEKYFKKGDEILVEGKIDYQKSDNKIFTKINVFSFEFCGGNTKQDAQGTVQVADEVEDDLPF